jgi:hypothetical protein
METVIQHLIELASVISGIVNVLFNLVVDGLSYFAGGEFVGDRNHRLVILYLHRK